nr:hypothetical protein [Tanacetum cinerariifolium]
MYSYQQPTWPNFTWQHEHLEPLLGAVRHQQGRVLGHMEALGFSLQAEALLQTLTLEALKSSEIEGEMRAGSLLAGAPFGHSGGRPGARGAPGRRRGRDAARRHPGLCAARHCGALVQLAGSLVSYRAQWATTHSGGRLA